MIVSSKLAVGVVPATAVADAGNGTGVGVATVDSMSWAGAVVDRASGIAFGSVLALPAAVSSAGLIKCGSSGVEVRSPTATATATAAATAAAATVFDAAGAGSAYGALSSSSSSSSNSLSNAWGSTTLSVAVARSTALTASGTGSATAAVVLMGGVGAASGAEDVAGTGVFIASAGAGAIFRGVLSTAVSTAATRRVREVCGAVFGRVEGGVSIGTSRSAATLAARATGADAEGFATCSDRLAGWRCSTAGGLICSRVTVSASCCVGDGNGEDNTVGSTAMAAPWASAEPVSSASQRPVVPRFLIANVCN